jgi:patatin-related protein
VPGEEVRFAVVLNGGVSLAVWMGGVVLELDRLTKAARERTGAYDVLQRLTGCSARADVITGTSAGGINGAALALTQVNRDADPALLRDLWIDQGRIETLLRQPFQGQPTSLLKGDEYFLPKLNSALELLAHPPKGWRTPAEAPIDLTITTTVLRGNQAVSVDSMGQQLPQSLHAGRFQFQRRPGDTEEADPFSERNIKRTAHRLALASRSSASFPVAFEPSFVPVGSPDHQEPPASDPLPEEIRLRPDMAGQVRSWGTGSAAADRSRYCADGGALANTPTLAALKAIEAMPATGPVRRVMLLVFPHAPRVGDDPPDTTAGAPTFAGSLSGLLGALTAQGGRSYVEALEKHNLSAAGRRGTRKDVLAERKGPADLQELTEHIYSQYKRLRRWRAGRDLAAWRTGMTESEEFSANQPLPGWSFDRVRAAAESAQELWATERPAGRARLPYAPDDPPRPDNVIHDGWGWGVTAALGITEAASDLLRRLVWVLPPNEPSAAVGNRERVEQARQRILELATDLRDDRRLTDRCWEEDPVLLALPPDEDYWTLRLACYDHLRLGSVAREEVDGLAEALALADEVAADALLDALRSTLDQGRCGVGRSVRGHVRQVLDELRFPLAVLREQMDDLALRAPELRDWQKVVFPEDEADLATLGNDALLARLLQLEITSTTLGDEVSTGAARPVELVQISAQTENPFTTYTRTGDDKLGGAALNRFGGFLKRSWRVNDWLWGRVDGATMLCRTMLDPKRIRRTALLSGYLVPGTTGPAAADLAQDTLAGVLEMLHIPPGVVADDVLDRAHAELTAVFDTARTDGRLPSAMPGTADVFAWALHLESVPEELPVLAQAVLADRVDGANPRSRGEVFLAENQHLLRRLDASARAPETITAADRVQALDVFDRAGIGWEPLREEAGSDLIIRTATSAAAVMTTVADSDRSGLTAAKPVTRALRGGMLLPYWAIWGLTSRQAVARGLALLGFALGGVALTLSLFGVLSSGLAGPAAALGAGAVLAAFAYGALRTGSLLHSIVLLTPLIPLVAYASTGRDSQDTKGISTLVIALVLALSLMLLGSIGVASGSVWAAIDRLADRYGLVRSVPQPGRRALSAAAPWGRRAAALLILVLRIGGIVVVALAAAAVVWWLTDDARIEYVQANHRWLWLPALAVACLGGAVAHVGGRWLQVLTRRHDGGDEATWQYAAVVDPRAASAGWSVLYGVAYLAVAWAVSLESLSPENPWWRRVAFATALSFALALLLVLPVVLPLLALHEALRVETLRAGTVRTPLPTQAAQRRRAYADDLAVRGVSYRRFVRPGEDGPDLTPPGRSLEKRVADARAAAALAAAWNAPARPRQEDLVRLRPLLAEWSEEYQRVLSVPARKRLTELERTLSGDAPEPGEVRRAFDRLIATLRRSRRRRLRSLRLRVSRIIGGMRREHG